VVRPRQPRYYAPEQRVVAVAHPLLVMGARIVQRGWIDGVEECVGRLVLVANERLVEHI